MTFARRKLRPALHAFVLLGLFLTLNTPTAIALGRQAAHGAAKPQPAHASRAQSTSSRPNPILRSVFVRDVLALPVVQQPPGNAAYVSEGDNQATQFAAAARLGIIGLLAHNTLSGRLFAKLTVGEIVRVVYSDGRDEDFVITEILRFQALQPHSTSSRFRNLATDEIQSAGQVFSRVYTGGPHVTFQTCISNSGEVSWGRLFVIAMPLATYLQEARPKANG